MGLDFDKNTIDKMSSAEQKNVNASLAKYNGGFCIVCYANFDDVKKDKDSKAFSMECGHQFCLACWKEYLIEKVSSGSQLCLKTKC